MKRQKVYYNERYISFAIESMFIFVNFLVTGRESVNFTVVQSVLSVYSIYLSDETKRHTKQYFKTSFKINFKKFLTFKIKTCRIDSCD